MTAEQIIKLIDAGYTKADIDNMIITASPAEEGKALNNIAMTPPEEAPAGGAQSSTAAGSVSEGINQADSDPEPDPLDPIKAQIAELSGTLNAISKVIINPSLADIKPLGAEDVITKMLKEV